VLWILAQMVWYRIKTEHAQCKTTVTFWDERAGRITGLNAATNTWGTIWRSYETRLQ
jgi:hypothetical protein